LRQFLLLHIYLVFIAALHTRCYKCKCTFY